MKQLLKLVLLAALAPPALFAQGTAGPFTISSSSSPCATIATTGQSTVGINVSGTFTLTLQPEVSIRGQAAANTQVTPSTSSTAQSTITSTGVYTANVAGFDTFLVCVTAYTSGSATIYLNSTKAIATGSGGGGSGTVSANNGSAGAMAQYASAGGSTTVSPDANWVDASSVLTAAEPIVVPVGGAANASIRFAGDTNTGIRQGGAGNITLQSSGNSNNPVARFGGTVLTLVSGVNMGWTSSGTDPTVAQDTQLTRLAANIVGVNNNSGGAIGGTLLAGQNGGNGGHGVIMNATSAITGPAPVKLDTSNANQIVITTTTDTGAGIPVGVVVNSPGAGANGYVVTSGVVALTLGTGTCSIGQFVIVDTTTNGRVQCTGTYSAGTVIGKAMAAQASVGSTFNVLVGLR